MSEEQRRITQPHEVFDQIHGSLDFPEYIDEAVEVWDDIAEWWDDRIGDGNSTQNFLVEPNQEHLLEITAGDRILDIACGAGRFTRRMADAGARVIAFDHSRAFIDRARQRSAGYGSSIEYRILNAVDPDAFASISDERFDSAVCTMGIMDMAVITPLADALPRLLKPKGRFVFSICHPIFNSIGSRMVAEQEYDARGIIVRYAASATDYLKIRSSLGTGIVGQPRPQRYFHRPISALLELFLKQGMTLDAFLEPKFPPEAFAEHKLPLSSIHFAELPQVLIVRLRNAGRN